VIPALNATRSTATGSHLRIGGLATAQAAR
jgi:hypothetical protein